MKPVQLAVIGAGNVGQRHVRAIQTSADVELCAVVEPSIDSLACLDLNGIACFDDAASLFENLKPDGVVIATPTVHHLQPALQSLAAGCHLLIEKPITTDLDESNQIIEALAGTSLHVLVGHHRRYYQAVQQARQIIQEGRLGKLLAVSGQWCLKKHNEYYEPDWRKQWPAGPVMTNAIHDIDLLRFICGDIQSVYAESSHQVHGFEKEDVAAIIMRFNNEALGTFILSDQAPSPWAWEYATDENPAVPGTGENCFRFIGSHGSLDFPNLTHWTSTLENGDWFAPMQSSKINNEYHNAFQAQLTHFAAVIRGDEKPLISAEDASRSLAVTQAVLESIRQGKRIDLVAS